MSSGQPVLMRLEYGVILLVVVLLFTGCSGGVEQKKPQILHHEVFTVPPSQYQVFEYPKEEEYKFVSLTIKGDQPLDVWVMPSYEDVEIFLNKEGKYNYYSDLSRWNDDEYFASGIVRTDIFVVVKNVGYSHAHIEMWLVQSIYGRKVQ